MPEDTRLVALALADHVKESQQRNVTLASKLDDLQKAVDTGALQTAREFRMLRIAIQGVASDRALARVAPAVVLPIDDDDASVTQTRARTTIDQAAQTIDAGNLPSRHMGLWRARPSLVVGFVGSILALAVSFGLPLTHEQRTAILAVIPLGLSVLASARGEKTKTALVKAALVKGSTLAPPDSR